MNNPIKNRYDFLLIFDVQHGNPNGDPDADNLPRTDPETGDGLVTDGCLKRKLRDYVVLKARCAAPNDVWVKSKSLALNEQVERAYTEDEDVKAAVKAHKAWMGDKRKNPEPERHYEDAARDWMCKTFYDVRAFGAVMTTKDMPAADEDGEDGENGKKAKDASKLAMTGGQVCGPVQLTFSYSVEPVTILEHALTVCAARKADKPAAEQTGIQGRKYTIPYGLYVCQGFISAHRAAQTGFGEDDLALLWEALANMFEHDRSAARGLMSSRKLIVFKHASALGNAPAYSLFERVKIIKKDADKPARAFSDYQITIDFDNLPAGIAIIEMI